MKTSKHLWAAITGTLVVVSGASSSFADDTELFFGTTPTTAGAPNVLLVIDTSGSMSVEAAKSRKAYNPGQTYTASGCSSTSVYYASASTTTEPKCNGTKINKSDFYCAPATAAFATPSGKYLGNAVRWMRRTQSNSTTYFWSNSFTGGGQISARDQVTCELDTDTNYPTDGTTTSSNGYWNGTAALNYFTTGNKSSYWFYDGNYVAYLNDPTQVESQSRMDIVKNAATELIDSLSGINVGLMRYSSDGGGGMVIAPVQDVTTGATALKKAIADLRTGGNTPLSETLHEAYLYYAGGDVKYGASSTTCSQDMLLCDADHTVTKLSVDGSRTVAGGSKYKSPITSACQHNYIVFLTDGLPNEDNDANALINGLDTGAGNVCYSNSSAMWTALGYASVPSVTYYDGTTGLCLKEQSRVLQTKDLYGTSTNGVQNVTTYFIGFGNNVGAGAPQAYLGDAAKAGGGTAEIASDAAELATAFEKTLGQVLDKSATFTSPSVAVNSFNKTQVLEDMYVAMFEPSKTAHWPGNVKKFKLRDKKVVGRGTSMTSVNTDSAVDPTTGFIAKEAKDFWQQLGDTSAGNDTTGGGAANVIPAPDVRKLYTYIGTNKPGAGQPLSAHPVLTTNGVLTDTTTNLLKVGGAGDPDQSVLINWARGDVDGDPATTGDARNEIGDPVHSQPAVVIYGNTGTTQTQKMNDTVVYMATNDGYLHAFDVVSGEELWAFIPQELLPDLKLLYRDATTASKHYSLDGDIRILKYDVDGDGIVETADKDRVFLYVSQGRGGSRYYALDITSKTDPKFMWALDGTTDLGGIVSKSWSTPTLGRVKLGNGSTQNSQKLVLMFGAGYDDLEDGEAFRSAGSTYGNGVFMIDAVTGAVLWSQTKAATGAFAKMTHAIPSSIRTLDSNDDGWTDRMYVGDMAGQLWRFDIWNGQPKASLVTGGVIASLGAKITNDVANNRTFYNPPDAAKFIFSGRSNYYNIAIGSGDRGLPRSNTTTEDRFYSIRDYRLGAMTQAVYDAYSPILDSALLPVDGTKVETFADGAPGWKMHLGKAEKALSSATTVDKVVSFVTYVPPNMSSADTCKVNSGWGLAYSINAVTAKSVFDPVSAVVPSTGIPAQVNIVDPDQIIRTDGTTPTPPPLGTESEAATCMSGVSILDRCVDFGTRVKTFWQDSGAY